MSTALGAQLTEEPAKSRPSSTPMRPTTRAELAVDGAAIATDSKMPPSPSLACPIVSSRIAPFRRL